MFGKERNRVMPIAANDLKTGTEEFLPEGIELIAREDIFSRTTDRAVLLIRAGRVVEEDLLPKLIRYGAEPEQFLLREIRSQTRSSKYTSQEKNVTRPVKRGSQDGTQPSDNGILIAEPSDYSLKRLMNYLGNSGVRMRDIHTIRTPEQLDTALNRYRPAILFVDESIHPLTSIFPKIRELRQRFDVEQVVLMVGAKTAETRRQWLLDNAENLDGVQVLFKPITPFSLMSTLNWYKARNTLSKSMNQPLKHKSG